MMMFFPAFFPLLNASALSSSIGLMVSAGVAWRFRRYIQIEWTLFPALFYVLLSSAAISMGSDLPTEMLKKIFGGFLILLSVYFFSASQKWKINASIPVAVACASVSGALSGLFGIGGPLMVIYFLSALPDKEQYLGTLQTFFFFTNFYALLFRVYSGVYTVELLGYTLIGMAAIFVGMRLGYIIVDRLNKEKMKKIIYLFLGLSGVMNLL